MQNTLQFLVKRLKISNKEAIQLIAKGSVLINGLPASIRHIITPTDEITIEGRIIKYESYFTYIAYYKPRGIECTLNAEIENNLLEVLDFQEKLFPIGRLDKESEGLLLLTNDGQFYNQLAHSQQHVEKEYVVTVNKELTEEALQKLRNGIEILGQTTRNCEVRKINELSFNIILTQGLNRQIRRMCYKLGYEVLNLKRIRIASFFLDDLKEGEWRILSIK